MTDRPFPPGSSLIAYLRDSGGMNQDQSVDQQERQLRAWCEQRGYQLLRIFADARRSGTTTAGREQFDEMIRWLLAGQSVAGVIFWSYARFAREVNDSQYYLAGLRRVGYQVLSILEPIPEGNVGIIVEAAHQFAAAEYSAKLRKEITRGLRNLAVAHHAWPNPIRPPFGYKFVPFQIGIRRGTNEPHMAKRLVIDPETAPVVQKAFDLRVAGYSRIEINQQLHIYKQYSPIRDLLSNRIYIGILDYGDITVENFCEPLIDFETWQAVQSIEADTRERYAPRSDRSSYLLSGLVFCAVCKGHLFGKKKKRLSRVTYYYSCDTRKQPDGLCVAPYIRADILDDIIVRKLLKIADRPEILLDLQREQERRQAAADAAVELERLRSELSKADQAAKRAARAITAIGDTPELLDELKAVKGRQADLRDQIGRLERVAAVVSLQEVQDLAGLLRAALQSGDFRRRQLAVRAAVDRIETVIQPYGDRITGTIALTLGGFIRFEEPYTPN